MKVNDPNLTAMTPDTVGGAGLDRAQQAEQTQRRSTVRSGSAAGQTPDSVSLSSLGSQIRALNVESPERLQKLDRLSEDVATNKYQVDVQALSNHLVENAIRPKT
jgi:anti-sigma28 factor (negative regulator of flagellin synthesis)